MAVRTPLADPGQLDALADLDAYLKERRADRHRHRCPICHDEWTHVNARCELPYEWAMFRATRFCSRCQRRDLELALVGATWGAILAFVVFGVLR